MIEEIKTIEKRKNKLLEQGKKNGYVTYVGNGETTITYTVTDGTSTITKSVTLSLSDKEKPLNYFNL
mgnify:CR=1 FL=1